MAALVVPPREFLQAADEAAFLRDCDEFFTITVEDKRRCDFTRWYPLLKRHSIRSQWIPLSDGTIAWLKSEGSVKLPSFIELDGHADGIEEAKEESSSDIIIDGLNSVQRQDLIKDVIQIRQLFASESHSKGLSKWDMTNQGCVIKLNWTMPRDSTWINFGHTLQVSDTEHSLLMLKSSSLVQSDLIDPFGQCCDISKHSLNTIIIKRVDYYLIFRQWSKMFRNREFRVFIFDGRIIAVTQRYPDCQFTGDQCRLKQCIQQSLLSNTKKSESGIIAMISNTLGLPRCVIDVYIDTKHKLFIVDVNPMHPLLTDPGCFTWMEIGRICRNQHKCNNNNNHNNHDIIEDQKEDDFELRVSSVGVRYSGESEYRFPIDAVGLGSDEMIKFMQSAMLNQRESDSSSSSLSDSNPSSDI